MVALHFSTILFQLKGYTLETWRLTQFFSNFYRLHFSVCLLIYVPRVCFPLCALFTFRGFTLHLSQSWFVSSPPPRKNPHQVDLRTARVFLEVAELHRKHLGGQLLFGPDSFLYIILGDGMITLDDMEEMDGLR